MSSKKSKLRVAVGMSGGVDSSVAAALLVEAGYDVTGVHLECWSEPGCRAPQDRRDALQVAMQLGIPFKALDFKKGYKEKVIEYFYREYQAGRTPNPDVMCNLEIKFGLFYDWVFKNKFDYVATGHYARICERVKNYQLLRGVDRVKDQTYFLYRLRQEQLKNILFPVGDLTKSQVRAVAKKRGLHVADKKDSVGVCFIGDINVQEFLRRRIKERRGEVVMSTSAFAASRYRRTPLDREPNATADGKPAGKIVASVSRSASDYVVVGEHKGVWFYTIGQRVGIKIRISKALGKRLGLDPTNLPPLYVVSKDVTQNRLIVGTAAQAMRDEFEVGDVHWITGIPNLKLQISNLKVRIRHGGVLIPAQIIIHNSKFIIRLREAQRGIAPGQSAVFYKGEGCLGGGIIAG
jgi:tRNA-specific 2-thiouridylase